MTEWVSWCWCRLVGLLNLTPSQETREEIQLELVELERHPDEERQKAVENQLKKYPKLEKKTK